MFELRQVWVFPESIWRRRGWRSFFGDGERTISPNEIVDALNFRLGTGVFVVRGL